VGARAFAMSPRVAAAQTGVDVPAVGSTEITAFTTGTALPPPDWYHGHHGIQAIVKDVGPDGGWPTLVKTNYVEWTAVMRVWLQVQHMWEAVWYGDVDYYEDRRALDALIATVPPKMQFSFSKKRTVKEAWDVIAVARIDSDRARKTTLQTLRKEWENLTLKPGEDVDDFALRLNTLLQKMVQFGNNTYDEERDIEIGCLKVIDNDEPQPLSGPITVGGKLHLTQEQWEACQSDGKKGVSSPSTGDRKCGKSDNAHGGARPGREDVPRVAPVEETTAVPLAIRSRHETTPATTVASLAIEPRSVNSHDMVRPMSHRWRSRS
jgi:hypothetical protein